jgi:hypothetical protein
MFTRADGDSRRLKIMRALRKPFNCLILLILATAAAPLRPADKVLVVARQFDIPVLTTRSPGAEGNKYGFEGGRVVKLDGVYHLFTSEMIGDPHWVRMKLAHWISRDRMHWQRVGTLRTSSGDFTGHDPRAALWSPIPIFDPAENRWNLFYVAYRAAPDTPHQWLTNHEGQIWRAVSVNPGAGGIGGPYRDVGVVLRRSRNSDSWEGLQGTDSFFPYRVGGAWFALYGSARTESLPIALWQVGLARASQLGGPWSRCSELNPLHVEPSFIENPIVTRLADGSFVAVYDDHRPNSVGYSFSTDGVHWSTGRQLTVQSGAGVWASEVRTPLGLIDEGSGSFTLFYSGNEKISGAHPDANGITLTPGAIGVVEVRMEEDRGATQLGAR